MNLNRHEVLRYVPTGKRPHDLLFDPGGRLCVTDWSGVSHVLTRAGPIVRILWAGEATHHLDHQGRGLVTDNDTRLLLAIDARRLRVRAAGVDGGCAPTSPWQRGEVGCAGPITPTDGPSAIEPQTDDGADNVGRNPTASYAHIARRGGKNIATVAIARTLLARCFYVLKEVND